MTTNYVSVHVEDGDRVRADFHPARVAAMQYVEPMRVPDSVHVSVGYDLDLWGAPDVVMRTLCEALVRAYEAIAVDIENDGGDEGLGARVRVAAALVREG